MSQISLNEYQIKPIFKAVIVKVLSKCKDLLIEVLKNISSCRVYKRSVMHHSQPKPDQPGLSNST